MPNDLRVSKRKILKIWEQFSQNFVEQELDLFAARDLVSYQSFLLLLVVVNAKLNCRLPFVLQAGIEVVEGRSNACLRGYKVYLDNRNALS